VRASQLEQRRAAVEQRAAVMGCHGAPQPMPQLTTVGGQVDIEVVRALDGWPARRQEFASEVMRRGAGKNLVEDGADKWAPSFSDGDAVMVGMLAHTWDGLGSVPS
jgi:hypothetical protein